MNFSDAATALDVTLLQLETLMGNAQFPTPTSNDGAGNVVWVDGDITTFGVLMAAVAAAGWQIDASTQFGSTDWATLAATMPGPSYLPAGDALADQLDGS